MRSASPASLSVCSIRSRIRAVAHLTPSANPKRLSDPRYVETFLRLNCLLLLNRECTALEKGDVITYLITIEGGNKGDLINVGRK